MAGVSIYGRDQTISNEYDAYSFIFLIESVMFTFF